MSVYQFPVIDKFQARAVTEPSFEPELFGDDQQLYVDLDQVRGSEFQDDILFTLAVEDGRLMELPNDYIKIICSGHRGCGKTTELKRLHTYLNHPDRYLSIFLSIEEEMEYGSLQPEDIFVWILLKLVSAIEEYDIPASRTQFNELARQFLSSQTVEQELKDNFGVEVGAETEGGINFFSLFKLKTKAKAVFSTNNATSTKIREEIRKNPLAIINRINAALVDMRQAVAEAGLGQDVLFIIDGSEKLRFQVYEYLFIQNPNLLQTLALNMIMAVPIDSYYKIEAGPGLNFSHSLIIPMIKLAGPGNPADECFKEVIERRIATDLFFESGVLDECVRRSGGCVRQLLRIVNAVIRKARGGRASLEVAQAAIRALGSDMNQLLTTKHIDTLNLGLHKLRPGDAEVREMLFQLVLLKYNGHLRLNPLLEGIIPIFE
ncbi:hypothetical protein KBK19_18220 [Microvirga sp. STR05]|uniref:ATP-binding protein n=1 Tax=Hymenobacter duratus TaxID=2771356 RepID=A0ABR8JNM6_9BACT|nr:hypothetical protein [Hymenobacter duratus]MBD2716987.1 hypothetical protein [Hymenobacter duratus]MBR7951903.1 hypothetical protein [Microvirga sp. STR05]